MATPLELVAIRREENPYAAPQTTNLRPTNDRTEQAWAEVRSWHPAAELPPSIRRWMNAALIVYAISFLVPLAPWSDQPDGWNFGAGVMLFVWGIILCWYPPCFPWWANVFFGLSRWSMNRARPGKGLMYAILGLVSSALFGLYGSWSGPGYGGLPFDLPYLCWVTAMLLQTVAAGKLWRQRM